MTRQTRDRYAQCHGTCTVDCGACKGRGRPTPEFTEEQAERLAKIEAAEAAPEGWEQRVESAANAAHAAVCDCGQGATTIDRQMIAAALSADARVTTTDEQGR